VNSSIIANISPWRAALVLALATGSLSILAQETRVTAQTPEVTVKATGVVEAKTKHSATGIHQETVSLSHSIDYSDLNLANASDDQELEKRIADEAAEVCTQLGKLYPAGSIGREKADHKECVKNATERAMTDAKLAIASQQGHALR
jgi:UrcA family protein